MHKTGTKPVLFGSLATERIEITKDPGVASIAQAQWLQAEEERALLAQAAFRDRSARLLLARYPRAIPIAIFVLVMAVTALSIYSIESGERKRDHAHLSEQAGSVASALERRSAATEAYLRAGAALFEANGTVTPELFDRFIGEFDGATLAANPDGFGWAPALSSSQIADFQRRYRQATGTEIEVFPAPEADNDRVVPVAYLRPDSVRNRRAYGYDMASDQTRRQAINKAALLDKPVATDKLVLLQEGDAQEAGFIVYMPVFSSVATGRELRGFFYSPINARKFLESALQAESRVAAGFALYDRAVLDEHLLVDLPHNDATGLTVTRPVEIANHKMMLVVESGRGTSLSLLSMVTLLFGILTASLLMVLARLLTRQVIEDDARLAWLEEQNSIRNSLTRELNHRVKNTLANVLSIIALTRRRAQTLDGFADSLDGRVRALSATHDLLTQSDWGTTPIRDLVEAELAPYARQNDAKLEIEGPDVSVAPNDALSLGLAIHELATNAAKYGALSTPEGKVRITWRAVSDDFARLQWEESGGPAVAQDRVGGFGTNLIEKIVAHELRNPVDLQFNPEGVACTLTIPLREPSDFALRAQELA